MTKMFSRRHYKALAQMIQDVDIDSGYKRAQVGGAEANPDTLKGATRYRAALINELCASFKRDNPMFYPDRFFDAINKGYTLPLSQIAPKE